MKLKDQVCSLELAKKLKELGFEQESLFYWAEHRDFKKQKNGKMKIVPLGFKLDYFPAGKKSFIDTDTYPAYTVAELGEMLCHTNADIIYHTSSVDFGLEILEGRYFSAETEADARAKMLIYLKEHKLIN